MVHQQKPKGIDGALYILVFQCQYHIITKIYWYNYSKWIHPLTHLQWLSQSAEGRFSCIVVQPSCHFQQSISGTGRQCRQW